MENATALNATLPTHRVHVVEQGASARPHWVRCEIGENLKFDMGGLQSYCLANWDERVYDTFVVAAAVQFCDHTKRRPSAEWGRNFVLRIPVHDPDHWNSAEVSSPLHDALRFLTCDRWQITFEPRKTSASVPHPGNFNLPGDTSVIIPFSDGLDSHAVAGLMKLEHAHKVIRVRLGQKSWHGYQNGSPLPHFTSVPYHIGYGKNCSVETSGRSRGFKFAVLSGLAAYMSGAKDVFMPESGQGALGPSLVPVGQAYEDYRNHPLFTDLITTFLSALLGHTVRFTYPRLWYTKAETLTEFVAKCPEDDSNWDQTRSCWQGQRHVSVSGKMRQCGICAACMLRRMSVHAAGLSECKQSYVWENLTTTRYEDGAAPSFENRKPKGTMHEYAIAGTLHLDHLAGILHSRANQAGLSRQVFRLSRSLGRPEKEIRAKLERLIRKHTDEWKGFVGSLGPASFVAQWVERRDEHVPPGGECR